MSKPDYKRKSTVRESVAHRLSLAHRILYGGKLKGKYLFRSAVRLVILYKEWIDEIITGEIGDDVTANVKLAQRKKSSPDSVLVLRDRAILLKPPDKRSRGDVEYIRRMLRDIKAFKRYPPKVRDSLASGVLYQYVPAGHVITRQGHPAKALYYIVSGEFEIWRQETDSLTGEVSEGVVGTLVPGDIFGEISLLHNIPRSATVVSKTSTDLLIVRRKVFNYKLRNVLAEEWDGLKDGLVNFNYFKGWTEETMRECCILSKLVTFERNEILLGDGKGMIHYVYFLLSGECRLIEHMLIEKKGAGKAVKYRLYKPEQDDINSRQRVGRATKIDFSDTNLQSLMGDSLAQIGSGMELASANASAAAVYMKKASEKKPTVAMDRISVTTVTLQDVINEWHEITDTVEMLMKLPSVSSLQQYPPNVQTVFMQICIFYRGACFGLGEHMENRRIVSNTQSKCLLIPRYWLTQRNRANIWERVKQFMNAKFPSQDELFRQYVENRQWAKYRKEYCENIITSRPAMPNDTKIYDVPYSTRINEDIVEK